MNAAREISEMAEAECIQALATTAQPGSPMAIGIAARLQQIQLSNLSETTAALKGHVAQLLTVAENQRMLAAKLDGQTDTLITLTRRLRSLTVWLVVFTVALCAFEGCHMLELRPNASTAPTPTEPAHVDLSSAIIRSASEAASAAASANRPPDPARFEIIQSPLAVKWTFRLDRFAGKVSQLVQTADKDVAWEEMKVRGLPYVDEHENRIRFEIFTSSIAARHTFLIDLTTGKSWRLTALLDDKEKETDTVWLPFAAD
jgi:hypothetical protein